MKVFARMPFDLAARPQTALRIAFVAGRLSQRASGVKVVVERLSAALERTGQRVRVFGLSDTAWQDGDKAKWTGAPAEVFATRGPGAFGYAPALAPAIRAFAPDIIHAHGLWMYGSVISANMARAGVANVISPHGMLDSWALSQGRFKKKIASLAFERGHLQGARCIHALNSQEAEAIRACLPNAPVAVVPNGVDLMRQQTAPPPISAWRTAFPPEARTLLYLGRLHRKKNLAPLIAAFGQIPHTSWRLVIAGPDQDNTQANLERQVKALGLGDKVRFVGSQFGADKIATLASADAFILPSLSEGLPMAVLEAWAARLPVLMSDVCNLPDGFAAGAAIDTGTSQASIARALTALVSLPDAARLDMGMRGHALVERDYTWDSVANRFVTLYEWCRAHGNVTLPTFVEKP